MSGSWRRDERGANTLAGLPTVGPSSRRTGVTRTTNGHRQASGSASRTPLSHSVASSSSATSNSSRFSLSTSFTALTADDISFFDEVIDRLAAGAHDFASLKRAYNQVRMGFEHDVVIDGDRDAFLWDILLKIVKVRGKDWATRWDAVRMAIGMEPRVSSESEMERTEAEDDDDDGSDNYNNNDEGHTSDSETVRNGARQRESSQTISSGQTRHDATREEIEKLREKMARLTAEAGSLAGSIANKNEAAAATTSRRRPLDAPISSSIKMQKQHQQSPSHDAIERRLRFVEQAKNVPAGMKRSHKATFVESASDEENTGTSTTARKVASSTLSQQKAPSISAAQRQFDEVVARSRSEREMQKRMQSEQDDLEKEAILLPQFSKVNLAIKEHLARKCFEWWRLSCHQRLNREMQTVEVRTQVVLQKVMTAWRVKLRKKKECTRGAEKVDVVRCKLRAWRVWRRAALEAKQVRRDERKSILKGAYLLTRRRAEQRIVEETFLRWKIALMERRTAHFRTQHLVRGAFSLWRLHLWREKRMNERQRAFSLRAEDSLVADTWESWKKAHRVRKMEDTAQSFDRQSVLQNALNNWARQREYKTVMRRKVALADRWRARRIKKTILKQWKGVLGRKQRLGLEADQVVAQRKAVMKAASMRIWMLKERQALFLRVQSGKEKARAFQRWTQRVEERRERMSGIETRLRENHRFRVLKTTFAAWRTVTHQLVLSQRLASERDCRKIKGDVMHQWKRAFTVKRAQEEQARAVDASVLLQRMMGRWLSRHVEFKGAALEKERNERTVRSTLAFWRARALERRQEMLAVGLIRSKVESRLRKDYLRQWLDAVIRRRSEYLEAGERRDALLLNLAWSRWIDACVRHEDLLSLSNSFLDVKRDDMKKKVLSKWIILARAERSRRERMEQFLQEKLRKVAGRCLDQWYDRYVDATLREKEYEVLLLRQSKVTLLVFTHWKAQVKALPAIHLDHARRKMLAFSCWREKLPLARLANNAESVDRLEMLRKGFKHWHARTKAKRALRAAARFGGPSAARLGAAAHFRQKSRGSPYGKTGEVASSSPVRPGLVRARSIEQSRPSFKAAPVLRREASSPMRGKKSALQQQREDEEDSSLQESDLVATSTANNKEDRRRDNQHNRVHPARVLPSAAPAYQGWMANTIHKKQPQRQVTELDETQLEDVTASSEPPSSVLEQRLLSKRPDDTRQQQTTPSPPASQAQSEATTRIRNSPRKTPQKTMDWLRMRKQTGTNR